jgi:hypothetical protein
MKIPMRKVMSSVIAVSAADICDAEKFSRKLFLNMSLNVSMPILLLIQIVVFSAYYIFGCAAPEPSNTLNDVFYVRGEESVVLDLEYHEIAPGAREGTVPVEDI